MRFIYLSVVSLFSFLVGLNGQATSVVPPASSVNKPLVSVDKMDLTSFLGRWFMMYSSKEPLDTFLKSATCVTQDMGLNFVALSTSTSSSSSSPKVSTSEVDFDVNFNFMQANSSVFKLKSLQGIAFNDRFLKAPGQFILEMQGEESDLWVLALGPISQPNHTFSSLDMTSSGGRHNNRHSGDHRSGGHKNSPTSRRMQLNNATHLNDTSSDDYDLYLGINEDDQDYVYYEEVVVNILPGADNSTDDDMLIIVEIPGMGGNASSNSTIIVVDQSDDQDGDDNGRRLQNTHHKGPKQQVGTKQQHPHGTKGRVGPAHHHEGHAASHKQVPVRRRRQLAVNPEVPETRGQYPWAIVSDASGSELFILARDPSEFKVKYDDLVLQKAQSLGFTADSTKPIAIEQGKQCHYELVAKLIE